MKTEQAVNQDILDFVNTGREITLGNITQFLIDSLLDGSIENVLLYVVRTSKFPEYCKIVSSGDTGLETSEFVAIFCPFRGDTNFHTILLGLNIQIEGEIPEADKLNRIYEKIKDTLSASEKSVSLIERLTELGTGIEIAHPRTLL